MKKLELEGRRFGRLIVIERDADTTKHRNIRWVCKCECGERRIVAGGNLKNGHTLSCGCWRDEQTKRRSVTHGLTESRIYRIYCLMKGRCEAPKNPKYRIYGGRGIKCEWATFEAFRDDMYVSYLEHVAVHGEMQTSIDRIDNDGNYCKENCRWATKKEQSRNQRTNKQIKFNGVTRTLAEWGEVTKIGQENIGFRLRKGWSVEDALTTPVRKLTKRKGMVKSSL